MMGRACRRPLPSTMMLILLAWALCKRLRASLGVHWKSFRSPERCLAWNSAQTRPRSYLQDDLSHLNERPAVPTGKFLPYVVDRRREVGGVRGSGFDVILRNKVFSAGLVNGLFGASDQSTPTHGGILMQPRQVFISAASAAATVFWLASPASAERVARLKNILKTQGLHRDRQLGSPLSHPDPFKKKTRIWTPARLRDQAERPLACRASKASRAPRAAKAIEINTDNRSGLCANYRACVGLA